MVQRKLTASLDSSTEIKNLHPIKLSKLKRMSHWFDPTWSMPPQLGAYIHTSDNKKVEMVQRGAARYVCNIWHNTSSISEMVGHLG